MASASIFEVQDTQTLLWHTAHIVDKQKESFTVKYIDPLFNGEEEIVEEQRIHFCGDQEAVNDIEYNEGDYIEVKHSQSPEDPPGWCLARIITKRDVFFFVHYENYDNIYDEIVIADQIRPVNAREGPKLDEIDKAVSAVPPSIIEWAVSSDALDKFNTIISKTGVYNVSFRPKENKIVIVGDAKSVSKANILLTFIIEHQCELIELDNENARISKSLENKRQKIMKSDSVEEVLVPSELLGLIIGKAGANITTIKRDYSVGVHIIEHGDEEYKEYTDTEIPEGKALIRVYGKDPALVKEAKKLVYLQRIFVPIPANRIDYIKGYSNQLINDMKEKSGCVKVFVQDAEKNSDESTIEVIGSEDAIEYFKMLLESHLGFFKEYQDKETTNRDLNKQMNKINNNYGEGLYGNEGTRGGYANEGGRGGYGNEGGKGGYGNSQGYGSGQGNKRRNKNKNY